MVPALVLRRRNVRPTATALTEDQLLRLATALEAQLAAPAPPQPSVMQAFAYMRAFLLCFLVFLIPQRSQVLKSLRLGDTMTCGSDGVYKISSSPHATKNHMALEDYSLPPVVSGWCKTYLTHFRPVLLGSSTEYDHGWVFVTYSGAGPRKDIQRAVKTTVRELIGVEVSVHRPALRNKVNKDDIYIYIYILPARLYPHVLINWQRISPGQPTQI